MAALSEHGGYIRGYAATALPAAGPVDAGATRDSVVNNAIHLYQGAGQHLVQLQNASGSYWTQASPSTSTLQLLDDLPPQRVFLRVGVTGASSSIVNRFRVSISSAGTATFRVGLQLLSEAGRTLFYSSATDTPWAAEFTTTNTTGESITPAVIFMPQTAIASTRGTYDSLRGDGSLGSGRVYEANLTVWAKSSAGAPRVHAWTAYDYGG